MLFQVMIIISKGNLLEREKDFHKLFKDLMEHLFHYFQYQDSIQSSPMYLRATNRFQLPIKSVIEDMSVWWHLKLMSIQVFKVLKLEGLEVEIIILIKFRQLEVKFKIINQTYQTGLLVVQLSSHFHNNHRMVVKRKQI